MSYLSSAAQLAFNLSAVETMALGHVMIDSEHLFLGLCKAEDCIKMSKEDFRLTSDTEFEQIITEIRGMKAFFESNGVSCTDARRSLRKLIHESNVETGDFSGHRTSRCKNVFALAERICLDAGRAEISLTDLLAAVLSQDSNILNSLLFAFAVKQEALVQDLIKKGFIQNKSYAFKDNTIQGQRASAGNGSADAATGSTTPFLDKFGKDITKLAREGKLDPVIGRTQEIIKLAQVLVQKKKNNPILVGDAGVGKTCIVEGFAQKIVEADAQEYIKDFRIIEINMGNLVAGTKYRGDFEEKLDTIIQEAASDPNVVLFIDEIHTVVGAGSTGEGVMDAANILKPALARGDIKCIGATTTDKYRKYIEKDAALERRFQLIWVDEPTYFETVQILKGLKAKYEDYYKITISDNVIEKAVELSMLYLIDFRLPDKAIDIIDQACAQLSVKTLSSDTSNNADMKELTAESVLKVVEERSRMPVNAMTVDEKDRLLGMEAFLKRRVMGQDEAIMSISDTIRASKSGFKDPNKPLGVFLLLGSSGIGKTELAKALTEFLFYDESRLMVFDMSEYSEKHNVARLIGAPPGYLGYEEEGQLTGQVRTHPYSVILFDEIEKAHPDVLNIFMQIFDEGRLTDAHGRKASFTESVIIMTSNLGSLSDTGSKGHMGFLSGFEGQDKTTENAAAAVNKKGQKPHGSKKEADLEKRGIWQDYEKRITQTVESTIRPELLNRIQKKVILYPLDKETLEFIVDKFLAELNRKLCSKGFKVTLTKSVKEHLISRGYSEIFGAREMKRVFEQTVREPLSNKILNGEFVSGCTVNVSMAKDDVVFKTGKV